MTESTILIAFSVVVFFCFLTLAGVLWRVISCLPDVTGSAVRSQERERQALFSLTERLFEKMIAERGRLTETTFHHAQERKQQVQISGQVEQTSLKTKQPPTVNKAPSVVVSDAYAETESLHR